MMINDLNEKKTLLKKKLESLAEKYPEDKMYSLDRWDGEGFPSRIKATLCNLPPLEMKEGEDYDEDCYYSNFDKSSFERRDRVLKQKYGFDVGYCDENLYYNPSLRSFCGYVIEDDYDDCITAEIHTDKLGIAPVGLDAKKVKNIIEDAEYLEF